MLEGSVMKFCLRAEGSVPCFCRIQLQIICHVYNTILFPVSTNLICPIIIKINDFGVEDVGIN